jgi:hypothetical protein
MNHHTIVRAVAPAIAPAVAALALATFAASSAHAASPCDSRQLAEGPVQAGYSQGDFGVARGACPRTEVGLGVGGRAIIENENFYGNVRGGARLDASMQPFPQLELFLTTEPLVYNLVIQSFKASHLGLGETSVGGTLLAFGRQSFALSVTTRLDLPTSIGYHGNAWPIGLEAGLLMVLEPVDELRFHGGLLGGLRTAFSKADPDTRGAVIANAGVDIVIDDDWLALVADLNGQALERGGLDHLSLGVGLRFVILDEVGLDVGANIPLAGAERNLASFLLRTSYRFE